MQLRAFARLFLTLLVALGLLAFGSSRAGASNVRMYGPALSTNATWTSGTVAVDEVANLDLVGYSGTLRLEVWAFSSPFTGFLQYGYQLGTVNLGQLTAGFSFFSIYRVVGLTPPIYGFYYPALILTEYTASGWVPVDWINFQGQFFGVVADLDGDGWADLVDNCPFVSNPGQSDSDADGLGDVCDACPLDPLNDADGDGLCGNADRCPTIADPAQTDTDGDGIGDACDACPYDSFNDSDRDGRCGNVDNCPSLPNADQADADLDGIGDACDACQADPLNDADGDGRCSAADNCPSIFNPGQEDSDADGVGDACDQPISACNDHLDNDADGAVDFPDDPGCASLLDTSEENSPPLPPPSCRLCGEHLILSGVAKLKVKKGGKASYASNVNCTLGDHVWSATDGTGLDYTGQYSELNPKGTKLRFALDTTSLAVLADAASGAFEATTGHSLVVQTIRMHSAVLALNKAQTTAKLKATFDLSVVADGQVRTAKYSLALKGGVTRP